MASVVDVSAYSCLQLLYALLLSERNKPYQMLAIGSWNFEYRENNKQSLGESIFCKQKISTEEALLKFHGVKVQSYEKNDNQNWEVVIKNVLDSENKAIINTDSYWCPWSRAYGSKHFLHSFLLTNMDNAYVTCLDPYMQVEQQHVHLSSVEDGFRSVSFIGQCQGDNPSKEVVLEGLHEDLVETSKTSMFGDLEQLDSMIESVRELLPKSNITLVATGVANSYVCSLPSVQDCGKILICPCKSNLWSKLTLYTDKEIIDTHHLFEEFAWAEEEFRILGNVYNRTKGMRVNIEYLRGVELANKNLEVHGLDNPNGIYVIDNRGNRKLIEVEDESHLLMSAKARRKAILQLKSIMDDCDV